MGVSKKLFRFAWLLLIPVRAYIRHSPIKRGKGVLFRNVVKPLLPAKGVTFSSSLVGGAQIDLCYREAIGYTTLLYGAYEPEEQHYIYSFLGPGQVMIDVGANIGLFSLIGANAVGKSGKVIAVEPGPDNLKRLMRHIAKNNFSNVSVVPCAAGKNASEVTLNVAEDGAFSSCEGGDSIASGRDAVRVSVETIDSIWEKQGKPDVSLVKVDVEGGELSVLEGSQSLIGSCKPTFIVEANTETALNSLQTWFSGHGYETRDIPGFKHYNYLFVPESVTENC